MNKWIKYSLICALIIFLGYNSVYIEKLSDRGKKTTGTLDAVALAQKIWQERVPGKIDSAVSLDTLKTLIETGQKGGFEKYTHALDIGNYRYALVKGKATVEAVNEDDISLLINAKLPFKGTLVTEFVYGNTLRDALGLFSLKDFPNTKDLNNISEALNKIVRKAVVPSFKAQLKPGTVMDFVGAVQINEAHVHFDGIEIVPVRIKIAQ